MNIKPTIGRVVLYHPRPSDRVMKLATNGEVAAAGQHITHAATVAFVLNDREVNLACFDSFGNHYSSQRVVFIHDDGDQRPEYGGWCEWMPYQKQVASGEIAPTLHAGTPIKPDPTNPTGTL